MSLNERLIETADRVGNITCMGLDPDLNTLPEQYKNKGPQGFVLYLDEITDMMVEENVSPAAFKPNFGFYLEHDKPMEKNHEGSDALVDIINMLRHKFPGVQIIADFKTGDIGKSSNKYAKAISNWDVDATVVHPYMGDDSVEPYFDMFKKNDKGIYVLTRTSNKGAKTFQDLIVEGEDKKFYEKVAESVVRWGNDHNGIGSVLGATFQKELGDVAKMYAEKGLILLIPGVGSQGGSAPEIMVILRNAGYDPGLARINSSSGITHSWKNNPVPENYAEVVVNKVRTLNSETAYKKAS